MKYIPQSIPPSWDYCFNAACPMCDNCLRFQTGLELPDDRQRGNAIYPNALRNGRCRFFRPDEKMRMATGFVVPDNRQMSSLFDALRHQIAKVLGTGGTYYLYRNGKRWLTPVQQQAVEQVFRSAGYTGEVKYAMYRDDYDFT